MLKCVENCGPRHPPKRVPSREPLEALHSWGGGGGGGESSDFKYVLIIMSTIREHIANFEKNRTYSELFI